MAQSQLKFATIELEQGFVSKAQKHIWQAEPNAHAANFLSPPQYCAERGFVDMRQRPDGDAYRPTCPGGSQTTDGDAAIVTIPSTRACSSRRTRTATSTRTVARRSTTTSTVCSTRRTSARSSRRIRTATRTTTVAPIPTTTRTRSLDVKDQCPNEPGSKDKEPLGCPTKPALVVVTDCEVKITQQIHFEFNKDKIRPESFPVLDAVVDALQKNPDIKIEVQGHTDNVGTAEVQQGPVEPPRRIGDEVPGLARRDGEPAHQLRLRLRSADRAELRRLRIARSTGACSSCAPKV